MGFESSPPVVTHQFGLVKMGKVSTLRNGDETITEEVSGISELRFPQHLVLFTPEHMEGLGRQR